MLSNSALNDINSSILTEGFDELDNGNIVKVGEEEGMRLQEVPTAADLRAELARRMVPWYRVAGVVAINPGRFGQLITEKVPLSDADALRIAEVLRNWDSRPVK
jgi:hypothetical protein